MAINVQKSGDSVGNSGVPLFVLEMPYQTAMLESQLTVNAADTLVWGGSGSLLKRGYLFVVNVSTAGQRIRIFQADNTGGIELLPGQGMVIGDTGVGLTFQARASAAGGLLDRFILQS